MVETAYARSSRRRLFGSRATICLLSAVCALCTCRLAAATFTLSDAKTDYGNERIEASEKGGESDTYTVKVPKNKKASVHVHHSSILAWRIPGMAEPGGLPSVGSHRVGHD